MIQEIIFLKNDINEEELNLKSFQELKLRLAMLSVQCLTQKVGNYKGVKRRPKNKSNSN